MTSRATDIRRRLIEPIKPCLVWFRIDLRLQDNPALHAALAQLPAGQRIAIEELKLREGTLQEVSPRKDDGRRVAPHAGGCTSPSVRSTARCANAGRG